MKQETSKDEQPFGDEWEKQMMKFTKKTLVDTIRLWKDGNATKKQLECVKKANEIYQQLDELKPPKLIDVMRNDGDPKKIIADLKRLVGHFSLLMEIQEINELEHPTKRVIEPCVSDRGHGLVMVRPCGKEYNDKTYLGFLIGDVPLGSSVSIKDGKIQLEYSSYNPAIYVPDLNKVVFGAESWWGAIESEEDFKNITDKDINDVWYVKAFKELSKNKKSD